MNKERLTNLKQTLQRNKEFTTLDVIEQLEQQIEKMKNCQNCKHSYHDRYHTLQCIRNCINFDKWELAE